MSKGQVIEEAKKRVGYKEKSWSAYRKNPSVVFKKEDGAGKDNVTACWERLNKGMQGSAWCQGEINDIFSQVYGQNKAREILYQTNGWSYYTPTCAKYFYDNNAWYTEPKAGDIVYYCSEDKKPSRWKGIYHVELVCSVDGDNIYVVGGNTNNETTKVDGNGGAVADKVIRWKNNPNVAGFGRPKYEAQYRIGWHEDKNTHRFWYANTEDSWLRSCWKLINNYWYYFGEDGYAYEGLHYIDNELFFFCDIKGHPKQCAMCRTNDRGALVPTEGK